MKVNEEIKEFEKELILYGNAMLMFRVNKPPIHIPWKDVIKTAEEINNIVIDEYKFYSDKTKEHEINDRT